MLITVSLTFLEKMEFFDSDEFMLTRKECCESAVIHAVAVIFAVSIVPYEWHIDQSLHTD